MYRNALEREQSRSFIRGLPTRHFWGRTYVNSLPQSSLRLGAAGLFTLMQCRWDGDVRRTEILKIKFWKG